MFKSLALWIRGRRKASRAGSQSLQTAATIKSPTLEDGPLDALTNLSLELLYEYTPLSDDAAFRLLFILPGASDNPLRCTVEPHTLKDATTKPRYKAISYHWGEKEYTQKVIINGRAHYATKSAEEVLLHIRSVDMVQTIWIDSICINQSDIAEKSQQIRMMDIIYENADETVVWLGQPEGDDERALDFLEEHRDIFAEIAGDESADLPDLLGSRNLNPREVSWIDVMELTCRAWFQRVWVVQELALSRRVHLTYGHRSVPWDVLSGAIKCCVSDTVNVPGRRAQFRDLPQHRSLLRMSDIRTVIQRSRKIDIQTALRISASMYASDPHDFVFALLGMVDEKQRTKLSHLGYASTVEELFETATRVAIEDGGDLSLLYRAEPSPVPILPSLPSWVPDFSDGRLRVHLPLGIDAHSLPNFSAGWGLEDLDPPRPRFRGKLMEVYGALVDEIVFLSPVYMDVIDEDEAIAHFNGQIDRGMDGSEKPIKGKEPWLPWAKIAITAALDGSAEEEKVSIMTDLARTLCGDHFEGPEVCRERFAAWEQLYLSGRFRGGRFISEIAHKLRSDWSSPIDRARREEAISYASRFESLCSGRRFCTTAGGRFGIAPRTAKVGDKISVLAQSSFPFVLRTADGLESPDEHLRLVGTCYINGLMYGEGLHDGVFSQLDLI